MRLLDELAEAFHAAQDTHYPRRIVSSLALRDQFGLPITPTQWRELERRLFCPLPPLERTGQRLWMFPSELTTIRDLAKYLAERRPKLEPPGRCTEADWREAQIFVGVRTCLAEAGNLNEADVVRSARLQRDLGLD